MKQQMKQRKKHTKVPTTFKPRSEYCKDINYTLDYSQFNVYVFPRITEWLNRHDIMNRKALYSSSVNNISWIYKQNRFIIHSGTFNEHILDVIEAEVLSLDYTQLLEREMQQFTITDPNL